MAGTPSGTATGSNLAAKRVNAGPDVAVKGRVGAKHGGQGRKSTIARGRPRLGRGGGGVKDDWPSLSMAESRRPWKFSSDRGPYNTTVGAPKGNTSSA